MKTKNKILSIFLVLCISTPLLAQQEGSKILITKIDGDNQYKENKYITVGKKRIHVKQFFFDKEEVDFGDVKYIHAINVGKGTKELPYSADDFRNRRGNVFLDFFRNIYKKTKVVIKGGQGQQILAPEFNFQGKSKVALIISNYRYDDGDNLIHTIENSLSVQEKMEKLGWGVFSLDNVTKDELNNVLAEFKKELSIQTRTALLIYYVGHGVKQHAEFIKCIDGKYYDFVNIVRDIYLNGGVSVYVYDACRNNPNDTINLGGEALETPNENQLVLFSTKKEKPAYDDMLFTKSFVNNIGKGDFISDEFDSIKKEFDDINNKLTDHPERQGREQIVDIRKPEKISGTALSHFKFADLPTSNIQKSESLISNESVSEPDSISLNRFYIGVSSSLLTQPAVVPCLNIGLSYKQWRFELGVACNIKSSYSDDIFIYDSEKRLVNGYKYKGDFRFFGNVGYDIPINKNLDFVPLLGVSLNRIRGEKLINSSSSIGKYATAASGTFDARIIWSPWKSRTFQIQGSIGFYGSPKFLKSDNYNSFEDYDKSDTIKKWATGVYFQIGVIWNVIKW